MLLIEKIILRCVAGGVRAILSLYLSILVAIVLQNNHN